MADEIPITAKTADAIEHFKKGRSLHENVRDAEAIDEFKLALRSDPDFVLAQAYLGVANSGPEALKQLELANSRAARLPVAERLLIEATLAMHRGESAKAKTLFTQLVARVPNDWRAHFLLGEFLFATSQYSEAIAELSVATSLNPNAGPAFNHLGYAYLRQANVRAATEAFRHYTLSAPNEANAHESYGEGLVAAGRFNEAVAAFNASLALSPRLWLARRGSAYAKFFAGAWTAGFAELAKARTIATDQIDLFTLDRDRAFAALAQRDIAAYSKFFDMSRQHVDFGTAAQLGLDSALMAVVEAQYTEAITQTNTVITMAGKLPIAPELARRYRTVAIGVRSVAEARLGNGAAVEAAVKALEATKANDSSDESALILARAMSRLLKNDNAGAVAELSKCPADDYFCQWQLIIVADAAKDLVAARSARDRLLRVYTIDPIYLYVRARLSQVSARR
jgi:tetratricopeptide (TPR) repeat protein